MEFEWSAIKEVINIRKHGISFSESVETFLDPKGFQMVDRKHSGVERRCYWIGKTKSDRILTTWFARRGDIIRIIGFGE
jgi:uncharacterized DUF497 family protein